MSAPRPSLAARLARLDQIQWQGESQLPVPPQAVIEFSSKSRDPNATVNDLGKIVEREPALTTELLRNVNSSANGLRNKVDSVPKAISLLGIQNATTILLTSALAQTMSRVESPLVPAAIFRRDSVERAHFALVVARRLKLDARVAYTATMVQDILLPILTRKCEAEYRRFLQETERRSLPEFELETFGWTHCELTTRVLLKWGFPESLAIAVLQHHDDPLLLLSETPEAPMSFPSACAGLLMDTLRQSPAGVTQLVDVQGAKSELQLADIAGSVDAALKELGPPLTNPVPLMQRLQGAMLEQLDDRRKQAIAPGRQFGNYVLDTLLRESTMGAIYLARHIRMKRPAALKILRADRRSEQSVRQFEEEAQTTSALRHPNTVAIFDYGHTPDDLFYYAMEFIDGLTLGDLVRQDGRLSDGRVIALLKQCCGSLAEAHELDLIHRDIKPENIMLSDRVKRPDHITIVDFGLVTTKQRISESASPRSRNLVGTPLYMAPEAALGADHLDGRSDLYSLGSVGYFLLTGSPVFEGHTIAEVLQQQVQAEPIPPSDRCDAIIAPELERLILKCLAKDPADRPQSAQELHDALAKVQPLHAWSDEAATQWWVAQRKRPGGECKIEHPSADGDDSSIQTIVNPAHRSPVPMT